MTVSRIQALGLALAATFALACPPLAAQPYEVGDQGASSLYAQGVFANYYTADGASQTAAQLYPAPLPVPARVGQTYYTYQPLYPHEHLYTHQRTYYNYYGNADAFYRNPCCDHSGGGALNKTTVIWQSGCNHFGPLLGSVAPFANAYYAGARHYYGLGGGCGCGGGCGACGGCGCGCR